MKKVTLLLSISITFSFNLYSQATFNSYELGYEFKEKIAISVASDRYYVFDGRPEPGSIDYLGGVHSLDSSFTVYVNPGEVVDIGYHDTYYKGYNDDLVISNPRRKITLYRINGLMDVTYRNTGNRSFTYDGNFIYRVDISAPTDEGLNDYPVGYKGDQIVLNDGTRNGQIPIYRGPDYLNDKYPSGGRHSP